MKPKPDSNNTAGAVAPAATCCAFFQAKVAFEIPESLQEVSREIPYNAEMPERIIHGLLELFPGAAAFECENLCSPDLLIVDTYDCSQEWVKTATDRINAFLHNVRCAPTGANEERLKRN